MSDTAVMTLTEFLTARLDEDELWARHARPHGLTTERRSPTADGGVTQGAGPEVPHGETSGPARLDSTREAPPHRANGRGLTNRKGVRMTNNRSITVEHEGVTYDGQIATIRSTSLGWEDHGILTVMLHCEWPGGGIGVGGFCLDKSTGPEGGYTREGTAYGLDHIMRIMETVGVNSWESIPGKHVIVLFDHGKGGWGGTSVGIAHPTDEKKVLVLKKHAESWRNRAEAEQPVG